MKDVTRNFYPLNPARINNSYEKWENIVSLLYHPGWQTIHEEIMEIIQTSEDALHSSTLDYPGTQFARGKINAFELLFSALNRINEECKYQEIKEEAIL